MSTMIGQRPLIFLWENFGPLHVDRCEAVARAMPDRHIVGLECTGPIAGPVGPASHEIGIHAQYEASEQFSFDTENDAALSGQNSCFQEVAGMGTSEWGAGRE